MTTLTGIAITVVRRGERHDKGVKRRGGLHYPGFPFVRVEGDLIAVASAWTTLRELLEPAGGVTPTYSPGPPRLETFLHEQMPDSVVDSTNWREHLLTALRLDVDIEVVSLHGQGQSSRQPWGGADASASRIPPEKPTVRGDSCSMRHGRDSIGRAWARTGPSGLQPKG
jgi:hypothetical protein